MEGTARMTDADNTTLVLPHSFDFRFTKIDGDEFLLVLLDDQFGRVGIAMRPEDAFRLADRLTTMLDQLDRLREVYAKGTGQSTQQSEEKAE